MDGIIGIVIVNYRSHQLLLANLAPLRLSSETTRVIIVDNFASLDERREIEALTNSEGWSLVATNSNIGFGAAANLGMSEATELGCVCFLLLNPDVVLTEGVIEALRAQVVSEPLSVVSPKLLRPNGSTYFAGSYLSMIDGRLGADVPRPTEMHRSKLDGATQVARRDSAPWLSGACLAFSGELLNLVRGFDESFFLYWEDVDFSIRARAAGASLIVRADLIAIHDEGGTQGELPAGVKSNVYYYFNCRNRLAFGAKHLSRRDLLRWIAGTPGQSWAILKRGGRRQIITSQMPLIPTIKGSMVGLALAVRAVLHSTNSDAAAHVTGPGRNDSPRGTRWSRVPWF